jgi:hypothetical protein
MDRITLSKKKFEGQQDVTNRRESKSSNSTEFKIVKLEDVTARV